MLVAMNSLANGNCLADRNFGLGKFAFPMFLP